MNAPLTVRSNRPDPGAAQPRHSIPAAARRLLLAALLGCVGSLGAQAQEDRATEDIRWTPVAPGVEVALPSHDGRFNDGNSIRIVTADGVVLVDPPTNPDVTDGWIRRTQSEGRSVRLVLATHWHSDHHQTASRVLEAFPEAHFVGHRLLQTQIESEVAADHQARLERLENQVPAAKAALEKGEGLSGDPLSEEQQEAQRAAIAAAERWLAANVDVTFVSPSMGIAGPATFRIGEVQLEAHLFRAHTDGDLVVLLPSHGVALTGDLLDELPFVGHGAPRAWLETLREIHHWPAHTFVPGHGAPFGKEQIHKVRGFLEDLVEVVDAARSAGESLDELVGRVPEMPPFRRHREVLASDDVARRFYDGTLEAAVRAAWREAE